MNDDYVHNGDMTKLTLTLASLLDEARLFSEQESSHPEPTIFGVTDGKAIGTYLEHKFQSHLEHWWCPRRIE